MTPRITERLAGRITVLAGAVVAAGGAIQATRPDIHQSRVESVTEHVLISLFAAGVLLLAPATLALGRRAGTRLARRAATCAATGQLVLTAAATWSNLAGEDASWFPVAAVAANLAWLGGWIAIAVALRRTGTAPRAAAIGLPLSWVAMLPLSAVGGGLLTGGYWIAVGVALSAGTLGAPSRREVATAPAR